MKKKILIALTLLVLCMASATLFSCKKEGVSDSAYALSFTSTSQSTTCYVSELKEDIEEVIIPSAYNGKTVESIGKGAFKDSGIVKVVIPDSVTKIEENAFANCKNLKTVVMSKNLKQIYSGVFSGCTNLTTLEIPDSIEYVGTNAFDNSGIEFYQTDDAEYLGNSNNDYAVLVKVKNTELTEFPISDKTKVILERAFLGVKLREIDIPQNVKYIGEYAFSNCVNLKRATVSDGVTVIGEGVFYNCNLLEELVIPFFGGNIQSSQKQFAYLFGELYSINNPAKVPETLKKLTIKGDDIVIDPSSFDSRSANLETIEIIANKLTIEMMYECVGLKEFVITADETYIDGRYLPAGVEYNEYENAYYLGNANNPYSVLIKMLDKDVDNFKIHQNTEFIAAMAISGAKINSIDFPDGLKIIYDQALSGCENLTEITVPDSVIYIGEKAFEECNAIRSISLPFVGKSADTVGREKFSYIMGNVPQSLKNITITKAFESLFQYSFADCTYIETVKLPAGVKKIENGAFANCTSLETVDLPSSVNEINGYAFNSCSSLKNFVIPNGVKEISEFTFYKCSNLTSVEIPKSVTNIGKMAFAESGLQAITIPDSVISIKNSAFSDCKSLKECTIPNSVEELEYGVFQRSGIEKATVLCDITSVGKGESLFYGCESLQEFTLSPKTTVIANGMFAECTSLENITLPENVTYIDEDAFRGCSNLQSITLNDKLGLINSSAFKDCVLLKEIVLPKSLKTINMRAFDGCTSLQSIVINKGISLVGAYAFSGCTNLSNIYCEIDAQPLNWDQNWLLDCSATVHWGYKGE